MENKRKRMRLADSGAFRRYKKKIVESFYSIPTNSRIGNQYSDNNSEKNEEFQTNDVSKANQQLFIEAIETALDDQFIGDESSFFSSDDETITGNYHVIECYCIIF